MRTYLTQQRPVLKRFLMALIEGLHVYVSDRNFSMRVMQKYTKVSDPEVVAKTQDYYSKKTLVVPFMDAAAIKIVLPADAGRKPEEFYDNSLIQEIVKDGFIEQLKKNIR
jgi:hypothetical protein